MRRLIIFVSIVSFFSMSSLASAAPITYSGNWTTNIVPIGIGTGGPISASWAFTIDSTILTPNNQITNLPLDSLTWNTNNYGLFNITNTSGWIATNTNRPTVADIRIGGSAGGTNLFSSIQDDFLIAYSNNGTARFALYVDQPILSDIILSPVLTGSYTTSTVPEPTTSLLLATGLLGIAGYRWHQRRREGTQLG